MTSRINQKVFIYYDMAKAKHEMESWIRSGWRVHTCTMSTLTRGSVPMERIIVIYEYKE